MIVPTASQICAAKQFLLMFYAVPARGGDSGLVLSLLIQYERNPCLQVFLLRNKFPPWSPGVRINTDELEQVKKKASFFWENTTFPGRPLCT